MAPISLRELAIVGVFAACACGAHILVFYFVLRGLKALWGRLRAVFA